VTTQADIQSGLALITGGGGQLATELAATAPRSWQVEMVGHKRLDITSRDAVLRYVSTLKPTVIINAAAYTRVDQAETERDTAFAVNEEGVANLAAACSQSESRLLHVSTDFVFDGRSDHPYTTQDLTRPINAYGQSKLAGESRLFQILPYRGSVFRTSWLYSGVGVNFVRTILRLISEREELAVVGDQVGAPTWARGLARVLWRAAMDDSLSGLFHWSDAGAVSWYDFALAIQEEAVSAGKVAKSISIRRLRTEEYPTKATRPRYSVLDCSATARRLAIPQTPWRVHLRAMINDSHPVVPG
jgi:dTDP-4-dehydrorhamnose reductase